MEAIRSDIVEEAQRIVSAASDAGVPLRLVGGVAVRLHSERLPVELHRPYQDIDLVTTRKRGKDAVRLLERLGYTPNDRFNAVNAGRRAVVYDVVHQRQIDIFVGEFQMCHRIELGSRLDADTRTIPLAELLLTKLQIVRLNRKDLVDIGGLVYGHEIGDQDEETINGARIAKLLSNDWGLWRTAKQTIESTREHLSSLELDVSAEEMIRERLDRLWERVEAEPKGLRWRSRSRVGDRARWYDEPEEVDHDPTGERL